MSKSDSFGPKFKVFIFLSNFAKILIREGWFQIWRFFKIAAQNTQTNHFLFQI